MNLFEKLALPAQTGGIHSLGLKVIQANVGLRCNQICSHCHLGCSPSRTEVMGWPIMEAVRDAAHAAGCRMIDLTGGAPELNPLLKGFIQALRRDGLAVQVRTNLTVLLEPELKGTPEFFREHGVQLAASMPCYLERNVDGQRGQGIHRKSVAALKRLNELGYGVEDSLVLNLVYNPGGPSLPPNQASLENDYRRELSQRYGICFSNLLTLTNMPIGKFQSRLDEQRKLGAYMDLLRRSFNPETIEALMCRHQLSVAWDGTLYDCDFNLALGDAVNYDAPSHIREFDPAILKDRRIVTGDHCFGCTAGSGSSCGGALA